MPKYINSSMTNFYNIHSTSKIYLIFNESIFFVGILYNTILNVIYKTLQSTITMTILKSHILSSLMTYINLINKVILHPLLYLFLIFESFHDKKFLVQ